MVIPDLRKYLRNCNLLSQHWTVFKKLLYFGLYSRIVYWNYFTFNSENLVSRNTYKVLLWDGNLVYHIDKILFR